MSGIGTNFGYTEVSAYGKQKKTESWNEFLASLSSSESVGLNTHGAGSLFHQFKDFQNFNISQKLQAIKDAPVPTERCAIVNDSDGILQGVYPQNVSISDFNHPTGTTVVGIASTYFSGSECNVHAGWKYTTESGFFNPNELTQSDHLKNLRETRDLLLTQSDWTQSRDVTLSSDTDWKTYRQTLRDLPANTADPANPTWPTKP
tara:strand:- start:585 stop:1196 length:612 start_codon:yes stop_codon:yes gene_type:complete